MKWLRRMRKRRRVMKSGEQMRPLYGTKRDELLIHLDRK